MQPTAGGRPEEHVPPTSGGLLGPGVRFSTTYYDAQNMRKSSRDPVPVDEFGCITAAKYRCPKCKEARWVALAVAQRGDPACETDNERMVRVEIKRPPLLPWGEMWRASDRNLRAVWAGGLVASEGAVAHAAHLPGGAALLAAAPTGWAARRAMEWHLLRQAAKRGHVDPADEGDGKRYREGIATQARAVGYCTAAGCAWTALAAAAGMDPSTLGGKASLTGLTLAWLPAAATWWRWVRRDRGRPEPTPDVQVIDDPSMDPDEAETLRIWNGIMAAEKGQVVAYREDGTEVRAPRTGKLVGTHLEDWHRVEGGWAATAVGPDGTYESDQFLAAIGKVAGAYRMKKSMITCVPDSDDENRALYLAQRTSPIADIVPWSGPESIDVQQGTAELLRYVDGTTGLYELYRPGWGSTHDLLCGTTGSGKSELLLLMLACIDRWAHYVDPDGVTHGLVADLLIDPQEGQSYEPVVDDLAAPIATTYAEALMMVRAFKREMKRRNQYLSKHGWRDPVTGEVHRATWIDEHGRQRFGRKWWNPLVDGPILTLNIDEAHEFLAFREFAELVTAGARMYRKCGMRLRIVTHTPLLQDLGGSMALRDMLTGGFVWVGRTANSLTGPLAFNGRLPVDPQLIPEIAGLGYAKSRLAPKSMLGRNMWEEDFYNWVRDPSNTPIGHPAALPEFTLQAFGDEFAHWRRCMESGAEWEPGETATTVQVAARAAADLPLSVDAVRAALAASSTPLDMDGLVAALKGRGTEFSVRTIRGALAKLREDGQAFSARDPKDGCTRHELTPQARVADETRDAAAAETGGLQ